MVDAEGQSHRDELRRLLRQWDPIGVFDDDEEPAPPDEYDCLIAPMMFRLANGAEQPELTQYLLHRMHSHFGLRPFVYDANIFASRLVAWHRAIFACATKGLAGRATPGQAR